MTPKLGATTGAILCASLLVLTGCGASAPYSWPYHHLSWGGERYTVTDSYLHNPGTRKGYWTSYGTGKTFQIFSVRGVGAHLALCIKTNRGYLLVIGVGKASP